MKPTARNALLFLAGVIIAAAAAAAQPIGEAEYAGRRAGLLSRLDTANLVVLRGADAKLFSNDVDYRFRQESNFLYLTGVLEPSATLLISPRGIVVDGKKARAILFAKSVQSGTFAAPDERVLDPARLSSVMQDAAAGVSILYLSMPDVRFTNDWLNNRPLFLDRDAKKEFEQKHPGIKIKNAAMLLTDQRLIKSAGELALIRKAIEVTGRGIARAMDECSVGAAEYALQAAVEYEMVKGGATTQSYPSIVGSGTNSLILHYNDNRRMMKEGEVIVMDVGAEYEGYAADVTRTIPVSGKFTPAQKEIYAVVKQAQEEIFKKIRPGLPWREIDATATDVITKAGYAKFIKHGVTHFVGLDVHDAGLSDTLRAGMVLTVEPGLYIASDAAGVEPAFRGWGVRIEDDVLVTSGGCEVLSRSIPNEIIEIERIMSNKGKK